jgi:ABC-type transporter Mla subunit MlaD
VSAAVANPIVAGLIAVVGVAALAYKAFADRNKQAEEDQQRLTQALRNAGDPTWALIDSTKQLVAEINKLQPDEAIEGVEEFGMTVGAAREFLLDFLTPIEESGIGLMRLARAASSGTDVFGELADSVIFAGRASKPTTEFMGVLRKAIDDVAKPGSALNNILIQLAEHGGMTGAEFQALLGSLDRTADAFDNNREAANKTAQEFVKSAEFAQAYATVFDDKLLGALIDSANASGDWVGALEQANGELEAAGYVIDPVTHQLLNLSTAEGQAALEARNLAQEIDGLPPALARAEFAWEKFAGTLTIEKESIGVEQAIADFEAKYAGATLEMMMNNAEFKTDLIDVQLMILGLAESVVDTKNVAAQNRIKILVETGQLKEAWTLIQAIKNSGLNVGGPFGFPGPENIPIPPGFRAMGGIITQPELSWIGEAGPEVIIPLTRPQRAMELMRATGLDAMIGARQSSGAAVNIENAVFNNGTDADLVAQKVNAAERARSFST